MIINMPLTKWYENEYFLHFLLTIHPQGCVAIFLLHFEFPGLRMRISLLGKLLLLWSYAETAVDSAIGRQRWGESGAPLCCIGSRLCAVRQFMASDAPPPRREEQEEKWVFSPLPSSLLMHPSF